jgi:hypothetical protein
MEILGWIELHPYLMIGIAIIAELWRPITAAGLAALALGAWIAIR